MNGQVGNELVRVDGPAEVEEGGGSLKKEEFVICLANLFFCIKHFIVDLH